MKKKMVAVWAREFDSTIEENTSVGLEKPTFFCQIYCFYI